MAMQSQKADDGGCAVLALTLRLLGCDRSVAADAGAPQLNVYYDVAPDILKRQQEFRKTRKIARDASHNSLMKLGLVMDWIERRIEVKIEHAFRRGTIDGFEENYHHVSFTDGSARWFHLTIDGLTDSGHVQQMLRDDDGTFSGVGPRLESRLV
jgi:hypothetical protein